jgi:putative ABC transport system ATP-binding protein
MKGRRDTQCIRQETVPALHEQAVDIHDLIFRYGTGRVVLDIPAFSVTRGERVFIHGPSGSGKTTLLGVIAGVLPATSGSVRVLGRDLSRLAAAERDAHRAAHIGYIFQMFNLIPYLSVADNIALPAALSRARAARLDRTRSDAAHVLAQRLGIAELLPVSATKLSVGQQQRVAAARALFGSPELVIADEPTSALDSDRRKDFLELLFDICANAGATLLFVSHDRQLEPMFDRAVSLVESHRETQSR